MEDGSWIINSQSGCNLNGYRVEVISSTCSKCSASSHLQERNVCLAAECQYLCPHMYKCDSSCYEYNNGHICKHIHRVHSLENSTDVDLSSGNQSFENLEIELSCAESVFHPKLG